MNKETINTAYIEEVKGKNLLYYVVLHYIRNKYVVFFDHTTCNLSKKKIKQYIQDQGLLINNESCYDPEKKLEEGDIVKLHHDNISFICKKGKMKLKDCVEPAFNKNEENIEVHNINKEISKFIKTNFGINEFDDIKPGNQKKEFHIYFGVIKHFEFERLKESDYGRHITDSLKNIIKNNKKLEKELELQKSNLAFASKFINSLLALEVELENDFTQVISDLENGHYDNLLYNFLRDYSKVINKTSFQFIIAPSLNKNLYTSAAIQSLIKPINDVRDITDIKEKFSHYENNKQDYEKYLSIINTKNPYDLSFKRMTNHLFNLFKISCGTYEVKAANILIKPTNKKYNFKNTQREEFDLILKINNAGEGLARDVTISSNSKLFEFSEVEVGVLNPNETRETIIKSNINYSENFKPVLNLICKWLDVSDETNEIELEAEFAIQEKETPWDELEKKKPYTIQAIEDKAKLYGRDEIVDELRKNILSDQIESYKLWGQKRVGKSSIVKTLKSTFKNEEKVIVVYRSISGLTNTDAEKTLNTIGESLYGEVYDELEKKIVCVETTQRLKNIKVPEFNGSLFPLEEYLKKLKRICKDLRFVFILDEFDRINDEFFLPGRIGDTFSLNIGKGLNEYNYIGFILVGSENMNLLDRQAINYNSYQEREVDTFDKKTQLDSFKKIITEPVAPHIEFSADAIDNVFYVTNGNPYFANLICDNAFKLSVKNKDCEIDGNTIKKAVEAIVNSSQKSHFEHFWGDGITEESNIKKERKSDIRRRILVTFSLLFVQNNDFPTRQKLSSSFKKPKEYTIENYEIENTINEFFSRRIFKEYENNSIRILPELFERWLCGPGRVFMIEGVSDLEALEREQELEANVSIKENELKRISNSYVYKGDTIDIGIIENYFKQFGGPIQQRRVFKLVDSIFYISKEEIQDFIKQEQKNIFRKSEIALKMGQKKVYRENVEIYSFPETIHENEELAKTFKILSRIRTNKTIKDIKVNKDAWLKSNSNDIIIIDSVITDSEVVIENIKSFFDTTLKEAKIPVKLVVLVITTKAKAELIRATSFYSNFKIIHYKEIEESKIKPFLEKNEIFETSEEMSYAFAEIKKHFIEVDKNCLNVLFENICPSSSLPSLWCETDSFAPLFKNDYGNRKVLETIDEKERLRTRLYHANTELSQKINKYIVEHLKNKSKSEKQEDWFRVEYIPQNILKSVSERWIEDGQSSPKESYFNFIDYKEIIKKNKELTAIFQIGDKPFDWCKKLNKLRREPAHPEKPAPSLEEVEYFEKIKNILINKMSKK